MRLAAALLAALVAACASYHPRCAAVPGEVADIGPLDTVVFIVGDAGKPPHQSRPVLDALMADVRQAPVPAWVLFAGDNVYPSGLVANDTDSTERLDAQLAVADTGATVRFVPGNHDWKRGSKALRDQEEYIAARNAELLPKNGCPGPESVDVGERLRLVFLDTQFWLHDVKPPADCRASTREEVVAAMRDAVATTRQVIIVAHHPLRSAGPHGGYFAFPAVLINFVRRLGVYSQDLSSPLYRALIEEMCAATAGDNVIWAAGHEHNLQLFARDGACPATLVSGNGRAGGASPVADVRGMRACSASPGYVRVEIPREGAPRVVFVEVSPRRERAFALR